MLRRLAETAVINALERQPAVALLGPRQVGKTTLAHAIGETRHSVYLDLERPADRAKLDDPEQYLGAQADRLVILDEIQRVPELFGSLRGIIDRERRRGRATGRFLVLGSASIDLLRQSSESLAGRIAFIELGPLSVVETGTAPAERRRLWVRGGFPESYLARDDRDSLEWRRDFIRTYLERDIPQFAPRVPAETMRRFWTMLAHSHAGLLNASDLARGFGMSVQTVGRYLDLLVDLLLVRRLPPHFANVAKRLAKSPRVYLRDSGIVHALLGLTTFDDIAGHPIAGATWEGFVVENLVGAAPLGASASFYRTTNGAEIDLLLALPTGTTWAIEIKYGTTARVTRGFHEARRDLAPARSFVVYGGDERYPMAEGVEAIGLPDLMAELRSLDPTRA